MLTDIEKLVFTVLALLSAYAAYQVGKRIWLVVGRGQGTLGTDNMGARVRRAIEVFVTQRPVLKRRPLRFI